MATEPQCAICNGGGTSYADCPIHNPALRPEPRDNRCPTCEGESPDYCAQCEGTGHGQPGCCPDPFHTPAPPDHGESERRWTLFRDGDYGWEVARPDDDVSQSTTVEVVPAADLDQARAATGDWMRQARDNLRAAAEARAERDDLIRLRDSLHRDRKLLNEDLTRAEASLATARERAERAETALRQFEREFRQQGERQAANYAAPGPLNTSGEWGASAWLRAARKLSAYLDSIPSEADDG